MKHKNCIKGQVSIKSRYYMKAKAIKRLLERNASEYFTQKIAKIVYRRSPLGDVVELYAKVTPDNVFWLIDAEYF